METLMQGTRAIHITVDIYNEIGLLTSMLNVVGAIAVPQYKLIINSYQAFLSLIGINIVFYTLKINDYKQHVFVTQDTLLKTIKLKTQFKKIYMIKLRKHILQIDEKY